MDRGRDNGTGGDPIRIVASAVVLTLVAALVAMVVLEPFAKDESAGAGAVAIDFGSNLSGTPTGNLGCPAQPPTCTLWNGALPAGSTAGTLAAPIAGVVVSFTLKKNTGFGWPPVHLRVVRAAGDGWGGFGASTPDVVPTDDAGLETFAVRLPVQAGDYVGLETDDTSKSIYSSASGTGGATLHLESPKLPAGGASQSVGSISSTELFLRARVEPDGDGDGYGDVTQDECPLDAGTRAEPCPTQPATTTEATTTTQSTQPQSGAPPRKRCPKGKKLKRGKCVKVKKKRG